MMVLISLMHTIDAPCEPEEVELMMVLISLMHTIDAPCEPAMACKQSRMVFTSG